jgi:hypothetical protein
MEEYQRAVSLERQAQEIKSALSEKVLAMYESGWPFEYIEGKTGVPAKEAEAWVQAAVARGKVARRELHIQKSGQRHNRAKLTDGQVIELLKMATTHTRAEIAEKFGISTVHVIDVIRGRSRTDNEQVNRLRAEIAGAKYRNLSFVKAPGESRYLTREQFGRAVFEQIKAELKSRGFSLWGPNFDPDYPISLRAIWNIRKGQFSVDTLNSLPGIRVQEWFTIEPTE